MSFKENGYEIIRDFFKGDLDFIKDYFFLRAKAGQANRVDEQAPGSFSFYGDPLCETILDRTTKKIKEVTGVNVVPAYSYTRIYVYGNELTKHRDRESCEISATLSLGFDGEINPIYFSKEYDESDAVAIKLNPGDMCIYKGRELWHWRPPIENKWYLQTFLHYVDEYGPNARYKFDERAALGMPEVKD